MEKVVIRRGRIRRRRPAVPALAVLAAVSCVPLGAALTPPRAAAEAVRLVASSGASMGLSDPQPVLAAQLLASDNALAAPGAFDDDAVARNALLPLATGPNPAARAFGLKAAGIADEARALECMTSAVYYEAASEREEGQRAVAQVVLNRVRHAGYPNSVCGVVYQGPMRADAFGCQFTFTCDGALLRGPEPAAWLRARRIAADALAGSVFAPVGLSTHYHTSRVFPFWASALRKTAVIGAHIFYRLPGEGGAPGAFSARHAGREPVPAPALPMPRQQVVLAGAAQLPAPAASPALDDRLPAAGETEAGLPQSTIRAEFAASGRWRPGR